MAVIDEPAVAAAVARCLAARVRDPERRLTVTHPRTCGWCAYPTAEIDRMLAGWNEWAGFDPRKGTYGRHEARVFQALPRAEQEQLVTAAQDLEPEPMPPLPATPADEEEAPVPWA